MLQEIIEILQKKIHKTIQWIINRIQYIKFIYYIILTFLVKLLIPETNLLIGMITLDGLYSSLHAITAYINSENRDMSESHIINMEPLYTSSLLDRYIYYGSQYSIYKLLSWFFWVPDNTIMNLLNCGMIFTIIPPLLNIILKTKLFNKVREKKEEIIKTMVSKQLANIIQFSSSTYLDKDIIIDYHELIPLFNNYGNTMIYVQYMIKNTLITLALNYVKIYSKSIYYKMIKYAYVYKTGREIKSFSSITAKKTLNDMVNKKQWTDLLNTNIYNAILYLFQENINNVDIFKKLRIILRNKITKMTAVYTIASFLNSPVLIPILSIGLYMCADDNREFTRKNIIKYMIYCVMIPYSFYAESYLLTNVICHFGYGMITNKIARSMAIHAYDRTKDTLLVVYEKNKKYNKFIMLSLMHIIISKQTSKSSVLLVIDDVSKSKLYGILFFVGFISKMNYIHLLCSTGMVYIGWGYRDQIGDELGKYMIIIKNKILINSKVKYYIKHINILQSSFKNYIKYIRSKTIDKIYSNKMDKMIDIKSNYIENIEEFPSDSYYSDSDDDEDDDYEREEETNLLESDNKTQNVTGGGGVKSCKTTLMLEYCKENKDNKDNKDNKENEEQVKNVESVFRLSQEDFIDAISVENVMMGSKSSLHNIFNVKRDNAPHYIKDSTLLTKSSICVIDDFYSSGEESPPEYV